MATMSPVRRPPAPAPAPAPAPTGDWFAQQGFVPATAQPRVPSQTVGDEVQTRPASGGGGGGPVSNDAILAILQRYPTNNEGMRAAIEEVNRTFGPGTAEILDHPTRLDKFRLRDGSVYDAMIAATGTSGQWVSQLTPEAGGHGGGTGGATLGSLMGGGGGGSSGAFPGADPSYDFRVREGLKALQASAAAKGTLLNGPTLKAIVQYGQEMGAQEYGSIWDRNYRLAGLGLNAAQTGAQTGSSYSGQAGNLAADYGRNAGTLIDASGNAGAAGQIGQANAWRDTLGDIYKLYRESPWGQPRQQPWYQAAPSYYNEEGGG